MCRLLSYMGPKQILDDFLYLPDNSLIKQSYQPQMMSRERMLNLAGFGMCVWDKGSYNPNIPYIYKTTALPFFDRNLKSLALKLQADCFIAHIRGVLFDTHEIVTHQNVHPFLFPGFQLALAHNGTLTGIAEMKKDFMDLIKPEIAVHISGTTDSEWIYALFLSQFAAREDENNIDAAAEALIKTFKLMRNLRKKHDIRINAPINLYISNGEFIIATRFAFDYGVFPAHTTRSHITYHTMWYTFGEKYQQLENNHYGMSAGKRQSIVVASEPLTRDTTTWLEVPEYSLIKVWREEKEVKFLTQDLNV